MVASVVLGDGHAGVDRRLAATGIGSVGDEDGAVHQGCWLLGSSSENSSRAWVSVAALAAAQVDDDVRVRPLGQLVLVMVLPAPKGRGWRRPFDGKGVDDPLPGDQRPVDGQPLGDGRGCGWATAGPGPGICPWCR